MTRTTCKEKEDEKVLRVCEFEFEDYKPNNTFFMAIHAGTSLFYVVQIDIGIVVKCFAASGYQALVLTWISCCWKGL